MSGADFITLHFAAVAIELVLWWVYEGHNHADDGPWLAGNVLVALMPFFNLIAIGCLVVIIYDHMMTYGTKGLGFLPGRSRSDDGS